MSYKTNAVVDRISEGKYAVILAEEIKKEFILSLADIDIHLREGLWLTLNLNEDDEIIGIQADETLTAQKQAKVSDVMAKLRQRKGSKYKK
ncbi:MAG TPA: DUF3006 family protein [Pseudogracilibacillus sp.]|nr:DUF3006 family protein [Pseudogracilibacillus sp.]